MVKMSFNLEKWKTQEFSCISHALSQFENILTIADFNLCFKDTLKAFDNFKNKQQKSMK